MSLQTIRAQVRAIEARPLRAALPVQRPLAFTLQFRGWRNACGLSDEVLARCTGLAEARLRRIYNHDLPTSGEVGAIAAAMDWPAERLSALIESDRIARAMEAA